MDAPKVKICGITREKDALAALSAGADYLGFVFYPKSPRCVTPERAREILDRARAEGFAYPQAVGVFVNEDPGAVEDSARKAGLYAVQLHGDEGPDYCRALDLRVIKALRVKTEKTLEDIGACDAWAWLCDAYDPNQYGGTGKRIDAGMINAYVSRHRVFLAGGLDPENVSDALSRARPFAVDVSSGVESAPGIKDREKIEAFIKAVKNAANQS